VQKGLASIMALVSQRHPPAEDNSTGSEDRELGTSEVSGSDTATGSGTRVVISDVLVGKDVVEGRDGRTDGRFCLLGIGRNGQIL
jgi:hypothetical protein